MASHPPTALQDTGRPMNTRPNISTAHWTFSARSKKGFRLMCGMSSTALSQAPTKPVNNIQEPDKPMVKPSPPSPIENPPPTSVATTDRPIWGAWSPGGLCLQ